MYRSCAAARAARAQSLNLVRELIEDAPQGYGDRVGRGRIAEHAGTGRGDHFRDPRQVGRNDRYAGRERLE